MKTIVLGLIFLGFTNLMTSQNELAYVKVTIDEPANTVKNSMINSNYYKSLDSKISSVKIRKFQKVVADYDIKGSDVYSSTEKFKYTVVFEEGENQITADYNQD
jgi:ribosomal protein L14E/L6E/L27E